MDIWSRERERKKTESVRKRKREKDRERRIMPGKNRAIYNRLRKEENDWECGRDIDKDVYRSFAGIGKWGDESEKETEIKNEKGRI